VVAHRGASECLPTPLVSGEKAARQSKSIARLEEVEHVLSGRLALDGGAELGGDRAEPPAVKRMRLTPARKAVSAVPGSSPQSSTAIISAAGCSARAASMSAFHQAGPA